MALARYDPLSLLAATDPFSSLLAGTDRGAVPLPTIALDIKETPDAFCVKADLPGMPKDAIKVDVDGDVLSIEAAREEEKTEAGGGDTVHRRERVSTWAKRSLRLPTSADTGSVDAKYEDGVLQLTIPKKKEEKERKRKVEVK